MNGDNKITKTVIDTSKVEKKHKKSVLNVYLIQLFSHSSLLDFVKCFLFLSLSFLFANFYYTHSACIWHTLHLDYYSNVITIHQVHKHTNEEFPNTRRGKTKERRKRNI